MDDQRRSRPDDSAPDPAEGVRIIGADEAAEAIERGDVAPRLADDELRYGDRPPAPPAGPRPALRFPLDASADPTRIERPPVEPPPDPVTGPVELPHWTEPPTGEVPAVLIGDDKPLINETDDDLDAWSSFATSTPRWRDADDDWEDDGFVETLAGESGEVRMGALGEDTELPHNEYFGFDDMEERVGERKPETAPAPSEGPRWDVPDDDWSASSEDLPASTEAAEDDDWAGATEWEDDDDVGRPASDDGGYAPAGGGRDLTKAIPAGIALAVVAALALHFGAATTTVLVTVILALCAGEYFGVLRKVGWEAATLLGIGATVALPLAVGWRGIVAWPIIGAIVVIATFAWYLVGAGGHDPRVLEGTGATLLGVTWIGGLGAAAIAIVHMNKGVSLLLVAILATVAYDVAGLAVGMFVGRRPLSAASPNKTVEGLIGGMAASFAAVVVLVGIGHMGPWTGPSAWFLLGVGAAVAAPAGDLCQSLLKRDLGVKDMGTLIPGHGGVLDRFDAMLFVLPTVFWLAFTFGSVIPR